MTHSLPEQSLPGQPVGAFTRIATLAVGIVAILGPWAANAMSAEDVAARREQIFQQQIQPLLAKYCYACHGNGAAEGDVRLDAFETSLAVQGSRTTWLRVRQKIDNGEMPPADADQPTADERQAVSSLIDQVLQTVDCATEARPGRVTLHRLNRVEYRNTIRDLLGVDYTPAADFPADDVGYGFDNIADVLSLPPILLEKYLAAAEEITARAMSGDDPPRLVSVRPGPDLSAEDAARQIVERVATQAYRRPVTAEELGRLLQLVRSAGEGGESFEAGVQLAVEAILVSPHFLFRVERDPDPGQPERRLDDFEMATRLAYFLWSSMPDEELFARARQGGLSDPETLRRQVQRMLQSPRSQALVDNFAAQWLELRKFEGVQVSRRDFPGFDERLRADMRQETALFFEHVLREDRSVLELLTADYTFLNERLAQHYGIPDVQGESFRLVSTAGTPRGGLISQGSVLTVTSNPTRTSPVKRGKWILENLLGEPPPPPPPNVPKLEEGQQAVLGGSLRQRLEQHRRDPGCASCHRSMDALGFALENFDAVGAWRSRDGEFVIDASGELPTGEKFSGPEELRAVIVSTKAERFRRCLAEKLLTYALGRGLEYYDKCAVDTIVAAMAEHGDRFSVLVWEIARSDPFTKREARPDER